MADLQAKSDCRRGGPRADEVTGLGFGMARPYHHDRLGSSIGPMPQQMLPSSRNGALQVQGRSSKYDKASLLSPFSIILSISSAPAGLQRFPFFNILVAYQARCPRICRLRIP